MERLLRQGDRRTGITIIATVRKSMTLAVRVPNWLGDAVMALPAIESIVAKEKEPIRIIALPAVAAVFPGFEIVTAERGVNTAAFRAARADRVILFTHSFATALGARLAGIPERIGYGRHFRSSLLTRAIDRSRERLHQVEEYNHLVRSIGCTPLELPPRMKPPDPSPVSGDYIVLAPGAKYGSAKRWTGFGILARELAKMGRRTIILGARGEEISDAGSHPLIENRVGATSMKDAIAIIGGATVVVSNDSGLAHVARALGRRTIVIFGPTEHERTAPAGAELIIGTAECAPCLQRTCPIDHRCMRSIPAARILEALA